MFRSMLKSKLHGVTLTQTALYYEGSITLPPDLKRLSDLLEGELVDVVNLNNGARLSTYVIAGPPDSTDVCLNGPAARLGQVGDRIHELSYALCDAQEAQQLQPSIVHVDEQNRPTGD